MGKSRSASRHLDSVRVQMARRVELAKHEIAMKMVADRVKHDAEFASEVLRLAGDGLREEIKKDALETIKRKSNTCDVDPNVTDKDLENSLLNHCEIAHKQLQELVEEGDKTHEMVLEQTDGEEDILVDPTQKLDYPKDGQ